jgi:hypothetical protein
MGQGRQIVEDDRHVRVRVFELLELNELEEIRIVSSSLSIIPNIELYNE